MDLHHSWARERVDKYDLNKDGKFDKFDYYSQKKFVRSEEDRNGDGKIDFKIFFDQGEYYKIENLDSNFDGIFDFKKSFKKISQDQTKVIIEIDKDQNGKFEKK